MIFGELQKFSFKATAGAYSIVTDREVFDSQITLTGEEVGVALSFFGKTRIFRGNVKSGGATAQKQFYLFDNATGNISDQPIGLNLVFPKPAKDELRLYLKAKIFKPKAGEIWFIFKSAGKIVLGSMLEKSWRAIGRDDPDDAAYIGSVYGDPKFPQYRPAPGGTVLVRDPSIAKRVFLTARYQCEVDSGHRLFTSRATGTPFLEAHHLVPLKFQKSFQRSLDFKENIVALCPNCHRAAHHATVDQTRVILDILMSKRQNVDLIKQLGQSDIYSLYSCETIS